MSVDDIPKSWPKYFDEAIRLLNWRLLPALDFSPKELLLGLVVNTPKTDITNSTSMLSTDAADTQMAYVAQQHLDGYAAAVLHAIRRKSTFDKRVLAERTGEVIFKIGQLVQVYRNDLDYTFKTERKLLPKWSIPRRVTDRNVNSYSLATLEGVALAGKFSARRLREFIPREGTALATSQKIVEKNEAVLEKERWRADGKVVEEERRCEREAAAAQEDSEEGWETDSG